MITEQEAALNDLITALKSLEQEDDIQTLVADLEELQKLYQELNIQEKIENNQGDLILTDQTIKGITQKTAEIRNGIVG
ncbi:MAG: hypothetical protein HC880_21145 [Bacteroidia bacterium]|nr:hypothetical protein [Bacteroidia bacterium]